MVDQAKVMMPTTRITGPSTGICAKARVVSWPPSDICAMSMAIPNLVAVLLLSGVVARETRHYLGNLDEVDQTEIPRVDK